MRFIVMLTISASLVGLSPPEASSQAASSTPRSALLFQRALEGAQLARTSLIELKIETDGTCYSEAAGTALDEVARLDGFALGTRANFPDYYASIAPIHSSLQLELADEFLKRGCLDEADRLYRSVIRIHIGLRFAAERQRAQIGIDDVRAKRASQ